MVAVPQAPLQRAAVYSILPAAGPKGGGTLVLVQVCLLCARQWTACEATPGCMMTSYHTHTCLLACSIAVQPQDYESRPHTFEPDRARNSCADPWPTEQGDGLTAPASCIFSNGTLDISVPARIINSSAATCLAPAWDFMGAGASLQLGLATSTCTLWQVLSCT